MLWVNIDKMLYTIFSLSWVQYGLIWKLFFFQIHTEKKVVLDHKVWCQSLKMSSHHYNIFITKTRLKDHCKKNVSVSEYSTVWYRHPYSDCYVNNIICDGPYESLVLGVIKINGMEKYHKHFTSSTSYQSVSV